MLSNDLREPYALDPFEISKLNEGCTHPDKVEYDLGTYMGHFICWKDRRNYLGSTRPTALTRFLSDYRKAMSYYRNDPAKPTVG